MHIHCHLKENLLDYGPIHSYWCFGFKRYNGILGNIATNNRSVELQLMWKLNISHTLNSTLLTADGNKSFQQLIASMKHQTEEVTESMPTHLEYYKMDSTLPLHSNDWGNISALKIPSSHKERSLDNDDLDALLHVYKVMFPSAIIYLSSLSRTINMYT